MSGQPDHQGAPPGLTQGFRMTEAWLGGLHGLKAWSLVKATGIGSRQ